MIASPGKSQANKSLIKWACDAVQLLRGYLWRRLHRHKFISTISRILFRNTKSDNAPNTKKNISSPPRDGEKSVESVLISLVRSTDGVVWRVTSPLIDARLWMVNLSAKHLSERHNLDWEAIEQQSWQLRSYLWRFVTATTFLLSKNQK